MAYLFFIDSGHNAENKKTDKEAEMIDLVQGYFSGEDYREEVGGLIEHGDAAFDIDVGVKSEDLKAEKIRDYWNYYLPTHAKEMYPRLINLKYIKDIIDSLGEGTTESRFYNYYGPGSFRDLVSKKCGIDISVLHESVMRNDMFYYMNFMIGKEKYYRDIIFNEISRIEIENELDCEVYRSVDTSGYCVKGYEAYEYGTILKDEFYGDKVCDSVNEAGTSIMKFVFLNNNH